MRALVTGGGGFLGQYIVEMLKERGDEVAVLGRRPYPQLEKMGVTCIQADLQDSGAISRACKDKDAVFHVAALAASWGPREHFYQTNVKGTLNIIRGCQENEVQKLIYTSSPSVVFNMESVENGDEKLPYPRRYFAHYPETKAIAEQHVLAANEPKGLLTCALRPHLIYGPRDTHIIPMLLQRADQKRLMQIGPGMNMVDMTYVTNAAIAHLQASDALAADSAVAGQAYFISDDEPVNLWDFVNTLLTRLGRPSVQKQISYSTAYRLAFLLESLHRTFSFLGEPRITRFLASNFAHSHYFSMDKAKQDFGYKPLCTHAEGLRKTVEYFSNWEADGDS